MKTENQEKKFVSWEDLNNQSQIDGLEDMEEKQATCLFIANVFANHNQGLLLLVLMFGMNFADKEQFEEALEFNSISKYAQYLYNALDVERVMELGVIAKNVVDQPSLEDMMEMFVEGIEEKVGKEQ